MRVLWVLAAVIAGAALGSSARALVESGRISPPLSVEGARAALAQAGVRVGAVFSVGPYRYQVAAASPRWRGANRFTVDVSLTPLPQSE